MMRTRGVPALAVLVLAAIVATSCRQATSTAADTCSAPTAAAVRESASRAAAVLQVTVQGQAGLTDGVTTTDGLLVRVDRTLAGATAPERAVFWPGVDTPDGDLGPGTVLIAFVDPHGHPTTVDGAQVPAYDVAVVNGLWARGDGEVSRVCKDARSAAVDDSVLAGL